MDVYKLIEPVQRRFRTARMAAFERLFELDSSTRVLDVGGYEYNWTLITQKPSIVLANIDDDTWDKGRISKIKADGRTLPFPDMSFDVAFSNSVIEHVGGYEDQLQFAREIRRVARRYYVQTPNRWFLLEPHLVGPPLHLLPAPAARRLARFVTLWGLLARPSQSEIDELLSSINLLDSSQLRHFFPEAEITGESFLGMTKSLIAMKTS